MSIIIVMGSIKGKQKISIKIKKPPLYLFNNEKLERGLV